MRFAVLVLMMAKCDGVTQYECVPGSEGIIAEELEPFRVTSCNVSDCTPVQWAHEAGMLDTTCGTLDESVSVQVLAEHGETVVTSCAAVTTGDPRDPNLSNGTFEVASGVGPADTFHVQGCVGGRCNDVEWRNDLDDRRILADCGGFEELRATQLFPGRPDAPEIGDCTGTVSVSAPHFVAVVCDEDVCTLQEPVASDTFECSGLQYAIWTLRER